MNSPGPPPQRLAWLIVVSVSLAVYIRLQVQLPLEPPNLNRNDLKHLYLGSRILLRGENPYPFETLSEEAAAVRHPDMRYLNPYVYPPFTGYFFGWLGKLDYDTAVRIWFWSGHLLLLGSFAFLWGGMKVFHPLERAGIMAASVSLLFPLYRSTQAGQLNAFLLFLLCGVFWLWRNGYRKWAGAVLGLAALVKVQPAFLVVWLLRKREWRALGASMATILLLVLIPATRFGLQPYLDYLEVIGQMRYGSSTWSEKGAAFYVEEGNIGAPALFYRTLSENPKTKPWLNLGGTAYALSWVWGISVLAVCWFCCRVGRRDEDPEMEMGAWIWGMLLIPSLFWDHYLVLALPAWFLLITRLAQSGAGEGTLLLAALCWGWISFWFQWFHPENLSGMGLLYLNATLPPALILFFLSARMAKTSHRPGGFTHF